MIRHTQSKSDGQRGFFEFFFQELNNSGCAYAVMRNYATLPYSAGGSDLDLLVAPEDEATTREIFFRAVKHAGGVIIGTVATVGFWKVFVIGCSPTAKDKWWGLRIDVNVGYVFKGVPVLSCEHLQAHLSTHRGISVLEPGLASVLGVLKEVLNNKILPLRYQREALIAVENNWSRLNNALKPLGERGLALLHGLIVGKIDTDAVRVASKAQALRRAFWRQAFRKSPKAVLSGWALSGWGKIRRLLRPSGVIVAVLGVDGVGKSTVIHSITPVLAEATHGAFALKHLRPGLLPPLARLKGRQDVQPMPAVNPHGAKPSGVVGSVFRLAYLTLDYVLGYWFLLRPQIAKSPAVILFDRYCYDLVLDPRRFRIRLPRWLMELFVRLAPRPDFLLCLHAPPGVIHARKQELSLEETSRQVNALRDFVRHTPNAVLISTEGTIEEVRDQALTELINFFHSRSGGRPNREVTSDGCAIR